MTLTALTAVSVQQAVRFATSPYLLRHTVYQGPYQAKHACLKAWTLTKYTRQPDGSRTGRTRYELIFRHQFGSGSVDIKNKNRLEALSEKVALLA